MSKREDVTVDFAFRKAVYRGRFRNRILASESGDNVLARLSSSLDRLSTLAVRKGQSA